MEAVVVEELRGVPMTVGLVTTELACFVVLKDPFAMTVGRPLIKKMRASLDFHKTSLHSCMKGERRGYRFYRGSGRWRSCQ